MNTKENQTLSDKLIDGLRKAATEIEELRVQMALGKMEAKLVFEDMKKMFNENLHWARVKMNSVQDNENVLSVINAVQHLQVQLSLGLAETKEAFGEQYKKISDSLNSLETKLNDNVNEYYPELRLEVEKFKAKLELLSLNFKLNTLKTESKLKEKRQNFWGKLESTHKKMQATEKAAEQKWEHFNRQMNEAFGHFKSAFHFTENKGK
jgi:hypothetical protein